MPITDFFRPMVGMPINRASLHGFGIGEILRMLAATGEYRHPTKASLMKLCNTGFQVVKIIP